MNLYFRIHHRLKASFVRHNIFCGIKSGYLYSIAFRNRFFSIGKDVIFDVNGFRNFIGNDK